MAVASCRRNFSWANRGCEVYLVDLSSEPEPLLTSQPARSVRQGLWLFPDQALADATWGQHGCGLLVCTRGSAGLINS